VHPDEPVVTGEAVALELRTAGIGSRGIATLIDLAITYGALVVVLVVAAFALGAGNDASVAAVSVVVYLLVALGYPVTLETFWRGRTLGKAVMGLRVVRDDGGPIRFRHAFVRGLTGLVVDRPGFTVGLAALVPMLATRRGKRLGDVLAGTVVLQDRVPGRAEVALAVPPPLAGWAARLDLSGVDDALAGRMRQLFVRGGQLSPQHRERLEAQLVGEVVSRVGPPPPGTPAWAVLAAVLGERRERALRRPSEPAAPPGRPVGPPAAPAQAPTPAPAPAPAPATSPQPPAAGGFAPPA